MVVGKPVHRTLAVSTKRDETAVAQEPELMAHGRLTHAHRHSQVTDAQLLVREGVEQTEPGRIGQRREDGGSALHRASTCSRFERALYG